MAMTITQSPTPLSGEANVQSITLDFDASASGSIKIPLGYAPSEVEMAVYDSSGPATIIWKWHETMGDHVVTVASGTVGYMSAAPAAGIFIYDDGVAVGVELRGISVAAGDRIFLACRR